MNTVPVIALTGYLGAGKTSLLNHVLRQPRARLGVVVNDFGDVGVDAGLLVGQVTDPAAISGGCLCCLDDAGGLDAALERLAAPRLRLDAIIVEASGVGDPLVLSRLIRFSGAAGTRPGGLVDVVDAAEHRDTVDVDHMPPRRYEVASLVVVNKLDLVPASDRDLVVAAVRDRVHQRNPRALVVGAVGAAVDPALLHDVAEDVGPSDELPIRELMLGGHRHDHVHAEAVTELTSHDVEPAAVIDLLESPPTGVYRIKGTITVGWRSRVRRYAVNLAGRAVHVARLPTALTPPSCLVAIGTGLDHGEVAARLRRALQPTPAASARGLRRLDRHLRLSL